MLVQKYEAGHLPVPLPTTYPTEDVPRVTNPNTSDSSLYQHGHIGRDTPLHAFAGFIYTIHNVTEGPVVMDDSWISSLLTLAPFVRIVEFFSAEIGDGGSQRTQRKDFMYNFYHDMTMYEKDHMHSAVFARASAQNLHSSVEDIWFAAAHAELTARRAIPHDVEHVWVWNGIPIVFGCPDCHRTRGWQA